MNELEPGEVAAFEHEQAQIQQMSAWLDRAVILGAQLEHAQDPGAYEPSDDTDFFDDDPINGIDYDQAVSELNMLLPRNLRIQFQGPGYTYTTDNRGAPVTVYRDEENPVIGSGELKGITILDDTDVEYICEGCEIEALYDDEDSTFSNTASPEACDHPEPSDLAQVFLEFETARIDSQTDDLSLNGGCVRTDNVRFYSLLIASSVQVELITPVSQVEQCETEDIVGIMHSTATRMRHLVRDTAFRRSSVTDQHRQMEELLDEANQYLGLDRFVAMAAFDSFYQKGFEEAERIFVETEDGHRYFNPCVLQPLRLDSLDLENQPNKAIRSNKDLLSTETSLYMVAEIDEFVQRQIGADNQIIWIPIMPKKRNKKTHRPSEEIDLEFHPAGIDLTTGDPY